MGQESVQSLERALTILALFCPDNHPTGVTELAGRLQLPKSTVHRLLSTLERAGFLTRTVTGKYSLGMRLWELGCAAVSPLSVRDVARPIMEELVHRTAETVHLAIWDQAEVVYLDRVDGTNPIRLHSTVGGRAPAHATASGLALLAFQDAPAQREAARRLRRFTSRTITTPGRLHRRLEGVRRDGYAFSANAWHPGSAGVAAPIRSHEGRVVAALSVAGPSERIVPRTLELAGLVRTAADRISRALGDPSARRATPGRTGRRLARA